MSSFEVSTQWVVILGLVSLATFVLTLLLVPLIVIRIPEDYFRDSYRHKSQWSEYHPVLRFCLLILKNMLGVILLIMGILMLVLPGQGILTILFGIALMNFPGKFKLERRLISYSKVLSSINWIRKKANRAPIQVD
jgi:archaellum biogenesis protein FlaJ (TadC family)